MIVLLGPQHAEPTVRRVLRELGVTGPVAAVTAGWQEREGDTGLLGDLGAPVVELGLHGRAEDVFAKDAELAAAYKVRQIELKLIQDFYRVRLDHAAAAARAIGVRSASADLLATEWQASLELIGLIDREHLARCTRVHTAFDAQYRPLTRDVVANHVAELRKLIESTGALVLAGGHVAVLLNRLRLFDIIELAGGRPIIACSSGAMALTERVVLFHEDPPHGTAISEILDAGLGLVRDLIVLPEPRLRLRLDLSDRVGELAQRYQPAQCYALDHGAQLWLDRGKLTRSVRAQRLDLTGKVDGPPPPRISRPIIEAPPVEPRRAIRALEAGPRDAAAVDAFIKANSFPIVEGNAITFVYRGDADAVHMKHWVFGLPQSQPLQRLERTNLWYRTLDIPASSRVEYKLEIVRGGKGEWIQDPLNPNTARDPFGANSVAHGTGYEVPEWIRKDPEAPPGTIDNITFEGPTFGRRGVGIYLPARYRRTRRYPLLIVHDGHDYLRYASLGTILDNLIARREIPELIVALTSSPDRLREYANDERQAKFLTEELVPNLEKTLPIDARPQSRCLMGASFGAVAALSAAVRRPGFYGRLLLQSGSFAFTDIGDRNHRGPVFDGVVAFVNSYRSNPIAVSERIFMSCGTYESLIYENRSFAPLLAATGMEVRYVEARDGHNWENWRDRLREGLSWLFPGPLLLVYD